MRTTLVIALTGAVALAATGCGTKQRARNDPRPATPIVMSATITPSKIVISPAKTGAGPLTLIVVNLSGSSQTVTLETDNAPGTGGPGIRQETGPINPHDTATLKAQVKPGTYRVKVAGDPPVPAKLTIGAARASSQNDLALP